MSTDYSKAVDMLAEIETSFKFECLSVEVDFINICYFPRGEGYDFHSHSNYEFHYIKQGKGIVVMNNVEYPLDEGSFYLTGPGVVHKQIADTVDPMVEYALKCEIKLNPAEEDTNEHSMAEFAHIIDILDRNSAVVVEDFNGLSRIFEGIFDEVCCKRPGYYTQIKNMIYKIIIASARNFFIGKDISYSVPKRNMNSYRMRMIHSYIIDNCCRSITCEELSRHLFLSKKQVNRIVRAETGYSVHDYIMSEKIDIVKGILKNSKLKLVNIAEQTGFSSEFHLSNVFKKWAGVSPSKFRES